MRNEAASASAEPARATRRFRPIVKRVSWAAQLQAGALTMRTSFAMFET
jgi:hypothetical protein